MKRLIALIASLFMAGSIANAQSADDFCATAPADLLSALDGTWTLTHGAGKTFTGAGTTPFPAPRPTTLEFAYWRNFGFGVLSGDGQSMVMLPADAQATAEHIDGLLSATGLPNLQPTDAECDWYALPAIIGTNEYALQGSGPNAPNIEDFRYEGTDNWRSGSITHYLSICNREGFEHLLNRRDRVPGTDTTLDIRPLLVADCPETARADGNGKMAMTLILKFDSPNSASGVASFRGKVRAGGQRISFAAETPVWMTR